MYAHMPIIRDILYGAANRGASLVRLCDELTISSSELNDSDSYLDFERSYQAWEKAVKMTGDEWLGLHLGETSNPSILGLIGHLMQSSPTLETAYHHVCEYSKLATNMFFYSITRKGNQRILSYEPASTWMMVSPKSAHQAVQQAMAGTLHVFKLLSAQAMVPVSAQFTFPKPKVTKEFERIFQSPLKFNADQNQLIFDRQTLQTPVITYDKSLYALFDQLLKDKVEALVQHKNFSDRVIKLITTEFKGQIPSMEVAASRMNMTPRSFQRKLQAEQKSYRTIAAALRQELALQLLKRTDSKMEEIADVLGYSEVRAFRRAFKTWTHSSPAKMRSAS